jgi:hypothetical protein
MKSTLRDRAGKLPIGIRIGLLIYTLFRKEAGGSDELWARAFSKFGPAPKHDHLPISGVMRPASGAAL